jgi:hypothetical protein
MAKVNERTLQMMDNFMTLHDAGFGVPEIAKRYDLSECTVYRKLGEIAEKNGVTRKELLVKPLENVDHSGQNYTLVKPIDPTGFHENYNVTMAGIAALKKSLAGSITYLDKAE